MSTLILSRQGSSRPVEYVAEETLSTESLPVPSDEKISTLAAGLVEKLKSLSPSDSPLLEDIHYLRSIISAEMPISKLTLETLIKTVTIAKQHLETAKATQCPDAENLAICQKLVDIVEANLTIIQQKLFTFSTSEEELIMHFPQGFDNISYAIASSPVTRVSAPMKGAFGKFSSITHEDGTIYGLKSALADTDLDPNITKKWANKQECLESFKSAQTTETSAYYSLNLSHDNIVKFFGVTKNGDIILEFIPGKDLFDAMMSTTNPLSDDQKYSIAKGLLEAVKYLHEKEVIHCDIKPENILLTLDLRPKLTDFATARHEFRAEDLQKRIGTTQYMAPEMLKKDEPKGPKIDLWSVGATLYAMASQGFFYDQFFVASGLKPSCIPTDEKGINSRLVKEFNDKGVKGIDKNIGSAINQLKLNNPSNPSKQKLYFTLVGCLHFMPEDRKLAKQLAAEISI